VKGERNELRGASQHRRLRLRTQTDRLQAQNNRTIKKEIKREEYRGVAKIYKRARYRHHSECPNARARGPEVRHLTLRSGLAEKTEHFERRFRDWKFAEEGQARKGRFEAGNLLGIIGIFNKKREKLRAREGTV